MVVVVVTGVGTLLFVEEAPIAHQAPWRHHPLSLQTDHPWVLQDPKKTNPVTDQTAAEVATCSMMSVPRRVVLEEVAVAPVKQSLLERKSPSAVRAAAMVAIGAMAVEMTANAAVEAI